MRVLFLYIVKALNVRLCYIHTEYVNRLGLYEIYCQQNDQINNDVYLRPTYSSVNTFYIHLSYCTLRRISPAHTPGRPGC